MAGWGFMGMCMCCACPGHMSQASIAVDKDTLSGDWCWSSQPHFFVYRRCLYSSCISGQAISSERSGAGSGQVRAADAAAG